MIQCQFEDGGKTSLRHSTVDAIVVKDSKILLIKRAAHLLEGGKWALPGGYLDRDETTPQGALRELYEETGYEGRVAKLLMIRDNPDRPHEDRQNLAFSFIVEPIERTGTGDEEVEEIQWFALDALPPTNELAFDHELMIQAYVQSEIEGKPVDLLPSLNQ